MDTAYVRENPIPKYGSVPAFLVPETFGDWFFFEGNQMWKELRPLELSFFSIKQICRKKQQHWSFMMVTSRNFSQLNMGTAPTNTQIHARWAPTKVINVVIALINGLQSMGHLELETLHLELETLHLELETTISYGLFW